MNQEMPTYIMTTITPTATDTYSTFTSTLFVLFLRRNGWTFADATWEAKFFTSLNINPDMMEREIKEVYYSALRRGASIRINRRDRLNNVLSYCNAANHASIHVYGH